MVARISAMNLESLHSIANLISRQRDPDIVLETIVESLVNNSDLALARIWLKRAGDLCAECYVRKECPDQTECLHLVASAARPQNSQSGEDWYQLDGFYRRFPLGIRRVGWIGSHGKSLKLTETAEDNEWFARNDWLRLEGVKAFCGYPLIFGDDNLGVLAVFSRSDPSEQEFAWLQAFADSAAIAIANASAFAEIEQLRRQLELENEYLRDELRDTHASGDMIGQGPAFRKVMEQVDLVAATDTSVLVLGESGVGKELVARAIHDRSNRSGGALVKVNCASVPRELFESEFFGHVKGSFTGASHDRAGRFELADGGTLFLDEVGEIPLDMQSKLLRVLQEGTYERIGDEKTRTVDVRIIAATNRDLQEEVHEKRFRQDLYYRLSVFPIDVVPLRDRRDDIPELAAHFLNHFSRKSGTATPRLKQRHIIELQQYGWPGNIRELQNVIERAVILARSGPLQFQLPDTKTQQDAAESVPAADSTGTDLLTWKELKDLERRNLLAVLNETNWKISGAGGAAELLGVNAATLSSRLRAMGITRPR